MFGYLKSAVKSPMRLALVMGVCAAVVAGTVLALRESGPRSDAATPPSAPRSPVSLPILNGSGNDSAATASPVPHVTADASPSSSLRAPTKTAADPAKTTEAAEGVAYSGAASGLCMDASSATAMRMDLASCDGRATELLTYDSSRQLQSATGLCATADGSSRGSLVVLAECNSGRSQRWTVTHDGSIRQGNLCIDAFNGDTQAGTPIQMWDCSGAGNQIWRPIVSKSH